MNKVEFDAKWKQIHGQVRVWWGKLTDDDLEQAEGKFEKIIGLLQEKYGYTRKQAEKEFRRQVAKFDATLKKTGVVTQ